MTSVNSLQEHYKLDKECTNNHWRVARWVGTLILPHFTNNLQPWSYICSYLLQNKYHQSTHKNWSCSTRRHLTKWSASQESRGVLISIWALFPISHTFGMLSFSKCTEERSTWASYQIRKIVGCAYAGNAGNVSPPPKVSDPDMHHGTCVTHVPWCMTRSLTSGFLWSWWRRKCFRHSRRMCNPQFYVSGKKPWSHYELITVPSKTDHICYGPLNMICCNRNDCWLDDWSLEDVVVICRLFPAYARDWLLNISYAIT